MTTGFAAEVVQSAYTVGGIPSLFFVGKDGTVKKHHLGYSPEVEEELAKEIEAELD